MMYESLRQKMKIAIFTTSRVFSSGSQHQRRHSTAATPPEQPSVNPRGLYKMLSALHSTGKKVSDVLYNLTRQGKQFHKNDLVFCLKNLRKYRRYQHCLEILEWIEKSRFEYSQGDYALRLDIIHKLKGIDEAEEYFDSLPEVAKNFCTYGVLLNCYCVEKMTDKAWSLFQKMDEMNYASNILAFGNLMRLYLKIGQPEKVPPLVQEMKIRKIPLNNYCYNMWMQSYGCLNDLEGVERVIDEVQEHKSMKDNWDIYSNLAAVYIKAVQEHESFINNCHIYLKAGIALNKLEEILDNSKKFERIAYHHLISLYANIGDLKSVTRVWDKLKTKSKDCHNLSYLIMLQALSKLRDIEGLKECFKEWESSYQNYDFRLPNVVIYTYLMLDMLEEAEVVLRNATDRAGRKVRNAHIFFMNYYLDKRDIESALKHMKVAIDNKWEVVPERLDRFFEYFKEEKDVNGAEQFCQTLKKVKLLDSRAYMWLLQTYVAAGKTAPEMRQRMEESGVNIGTEHEDLLEEVCPKMS